MFIRSIISSHKRFGSLCSWRLQWPVTLIWFIYEASYSFIVFYLFVVLLSSFRFGTQLQLCLSLLIPTHCSILPNVQTAYGAHASVTRPEGRAGHAPKSTVAGPRLRGAISPFLRTSSCHRKNLWLFSELNSRLLAFLGPNYRFVDDRPSILSHPRDVQF